MSNSKADEIDAAGRRLWPRNEAGQSTPLRRESDRQWLERSQASNQRHAAITRSLYNLSSYQNWTDRMRSHWQDAEQERGVEQEQG